MLSHRFLHSLGLILADWSALWRTTECRNNKLFPWPGDVSVGWTRPRRKHVIAPLPPFLFVLRAAWPQDAFWKYHGGSGSAAMWRDGSSIIREAFLSSPWKQREYFWTHLIDSFTGWFHWDTADLGLQLFSKEEGAQRGSFVTSPLIANQRQHHTGRLPKPKGEDIWQHGSQRFLELLDSCLKNLTVFLEKEKALTAKWPGMW